MWELLAGLGFVLAVEGILYAAFPEAMRRAMAQIIATPQEWLRLGGLLAAVLGVVLVWIARRGFLG